jgi:3-methyl-2-oxobutanoate hydroxymethyltransferase
MSKESKMNRVTITRLREMKRSGEKIAMLTSYDFSTASIVDKSGVDMILVGDSLGMVMLGYDSTLPVTMEDMIHHTKAVARAAKHAMIIVDMPFMSYQASIDDAVANAGRLMKESGAHGVKLEGGREFAGVIKRIVSAGIPVMGHLGLTPQSVHQLGGYRIQGKDDETAKTIMEDARIIEDAGAFSLVLECVPAALAAEITKSLEIFTIGIGAGVQCDGQVLVVNDMLGMFEKFMPKFVKEYAKLSVDMKKAIEQYVNDVKKETFPGEEHSF